MWLGLLEPEEGDVHLFGGSPLDADHRRRVGVMMQEVGLTPELRVRELIELTASYYPEPLPTDRTLELTRLGALAGRPYAKLSAGQKRQVQFALAICGRPSLLFLDEPTVGLDVDAREAMWRTIRELIAQGCSIVLTTHYLEEAEALADRVAVLAGGRLIASGSVAQIRSLVSRKQISCSSGAERRRHSFVAGRRRGDARRPTVCRSPSSMPRPSSGGSWLPTLTFEISRSARPDWPRHSPSSRRRPPDERRTIAGPVEPHGADADRPHPARLREGSAIRIAPHAALAGIRDSVPAVAGAGLSVLRRHAGRPAVAKNPGVANYLFSGFSVFAVMGPALFGAGCALAVERDAGFLNLKRAQPAPGGAYLIAKMLMSMVFAALAMASMLAAAILGNTVSLTTGQLLIMTVVMIVGAVPFCAIGLLIGSYTSGSSAPAFVNIVFLPMLWLSGLFIPLPKFLEKWAVIWPAFHLNQVALGSAGVSEFTFINPVISAAVLVGVTVLFGGLAIRRLARRG